MTWVVIAAGIWMAAAAILGPVIGRCLHTLGQPYETATRQALNLANAPASKPPMASLPPTAAGQALNVTSAKPPPSVPRLLPPPAPPKPPAPGPAPGHTHGGLTTVIRMYHCGCIHFLDGRGAITDVMPCGRPGFDVAEWERRLSQ